MHARFEAARSSGSSSMLPSGRRHHDFLRPATATTAEAELLQRWPHGLPVSCCCACRMPVDVSLPSAVMSEIATLHAVLLAVLPSSGWAYEWETTSYAIVCKLCARCAGNAR